MTENRGGALSVVPQENIGSQLMIIADPKALRFQLDQMKAVVNEYLEAGQDYGVIPGTGTKPTLLKPGAEKLMELYGLYPTYRCIDKVENWDAKPALFDFTYEATLRRRSDDMIFGVGVGSCSSYESRYRYRHAAKSCPECGVQAIIKGKEQYGGGWLCYKNKGGCGAKWPDGATIIESQETGKIENPDLADQKNTIIKQACKRALISGVLAATRSSGTFTQDLEDFKKAPGFDYGTDIVDGEIIDEEAPGPKSSSSSSQTSSTPSHTSQGQGSGARNATTTTASTQNTPGSARNGQQPTSTSGNTEKKSTATTAQASGSQSRAGASGASQQTSNQQTQATGGNVETEAKKQNAGNAARSGNQSTGDAGNAAQGTSKPAASSATTAKTDGYSSSVQDSSAQPATSQTSESTSLISDDQRKGLIATAKEKKGWTPPQVAQYLKSIGTTLSKLTQEQLAVALDYTSKNAPK